MEKYIKITLIKSPIGRIPKHREMVKQLGLGKMNSSAVHSDIPAIRGITNAIHYLLRVEEAV